MNRKIWISIIAAIILIFAIFTIASGSPTNPPVERQVEWDSPTTQELFYRACADCHSNETKWPWYAKIPPSSWLVSHDVKEGREKFNISARDLGEADEAAEAVLEEEMPMKIYLIMHPEARLTTAERQTLADGLRNTFGQEEYEHEGEEKDND